MKKARILAAVMAAALMTGAIPVSPIAEYFDSNVITASAETNVVQWDKNEIHDAVKTWAISSVVFLDNKPENGTVRTAGSVSSDGSIVAGPANDTSGIMYIWADKGGKVIAPADCSWLFYNMQTLTSIDLSGLNTSNVTDMSHMFEYCVNLNNLDLSGFDTSSVTTIYNMFYNSGIQTINFGDFDTSKVTNMYGVFWNCEKLTSLDLSKFDTSKVKDMSHMFYGCERLTYLDLSNFDTSNVTDMSYMFSDCERLSELEIWNFTVNEGTDTSDFCAGCSRLKSVGCSGTEDILKKLGIGTDVVKSISVDGYSVDITNGSFMLNIYIKHSTEIAESSLAFVRFQLPNGTKKDISVSDGVSKTVEGKTYLVYSVPVSAKDMKSDVAVEFYTDTGSKIMDAVNVSIKKYAEALVKKNPEYDDLVFWMLTYGDFANYYFSNSENYPSSFQSNLNADLIPTSAGITDENYVGSSLLLKDKITLRHYFNTKVNGAKQKGNLWYVEKAFNPTEFDQKIEGYDYTVNNYIKKVLKGDYDNHLKCLCRALYLYSVAALDLVKSN